MLGFQLRTGRTAPTGAVASSAAAQALFRNGEQGVLYDPNDLSTLFQDAAGTTPVTAAGQPVGLMLDKRLGLVLGAELAPAAWSSGNQAAISFVGGVVRVTYGGAPSPYAFGVLATEVGRWYRLRVRIAAQSNPAATSSVRVGLVQGAGSLYSEPLTAGLRDKTIHFLATSTQTVLSLLHADNSAGGYVEFDGISIREIPGNHAFIATAASRSMLRQNVTTGAYYLETDGSDDWMQTNPIDFTGTDKASVFAGVRKLSDAASGVVFELGTDTGSVNGTFRLSAPASAGAQKFLFVVRGTSGQEADTASTAWNAPVSVVASGVGNISGSSVKLRLNGADIETTAATLGTGNYGNYPLYLFRRGGTSLPFNGHFYGLVIVGRLTTDAETRNVERLYANKTGVTLA